MTFSKRRGSSILTCRFLVAKLNILSRSLFSISYIPVKSMQSRKNSYLKHQFIAFSNKADWNYPPWTTNKRIALFALFNFWFAITWSCFPIRSSNLSPPWPFSRNRQGFPPWSRGRSWERWKASAVRPGWELETACGLADNRSRPRQPIFYRKTTLASGRANLINCRVLIKIPESFLGRAFYLFGVRYREETFGWNGVSHAVYQAVIQPTLRCPSKNFYSLADNAKTIHIDHKFDYSYYFSHFLTCFVTVSDHLPLILQETLEYANFRFNGDISILMTDKIETETEKLFTFIKNLIKVVISIIS